MVEDDGVDMKVVNLGRSTCHAIRGRRDESTRIPDITWAAGTIRTFKSARLRQGLSGRRYYRTGGVY